MESKVQISSCPDSRCTADGWRRPLGGSAATTAAQLPPVVALGKFDALHKGHQALAIAAAHLGGHPWLISFSGMAAVLGWPRRLPLVAPCDRDRVLRRWAASCRGLVPRECAIPFTEVRTMSPEAFVALLAEELRVAGVVVGANYRFGYRAAGDAGLLQRLGPQYGMQVRVLDLVGSYCGSLSEGELGPGCFPPPEEGAGAGATVSSSRIREELAAGGMVQVEECLGRPYRLVASMAGASATQKLGGPALRLPSDTFLNQPPGPGHYQVAVGCCEASGCTLACPGDDGGAAPWQQGQLVIDESGLTLGGVAVGEEWREQGGLLVMDFLGNKEEMV
ncbi:hypothetical protein N2152v2_002081 [Parachlorella kessleri]